MNRDIFNRRIARINRHTGYGSAEMSCGEGVACSMFSSPAAYDRIPTARFNIKPMLMGGVIGMIVGTLAAGLENLAMPWGPGFAYNDLIFLPILLALCAAPFMAMAGAAMRARFPTFFFFAAAYLPCAVSTALLDLPLF